MNLRNSRPSNVVSPEQWAKIMDALKAIANNAKRLLTDAELLYSQKRYPSALALAILSLEEFGKYHLIQSQGFEKAIEIGRQHKTKQKIYGNYIFNTSVDRALSA